MWTPRGRRASRHSEAGATIERLACNDTFVELAWKVDVTNSCQQAFRVSVTFMIYDSDDFELDSDDEAILVPSNGTGNARGTMLVSPPSKARRMSKQGASLALH